MYIEKAKLLEHEAIYWININTDINENTKNCPTCLNFQAAQAKDKALSHEIPGRPWKSVKADTFTIINKQYLCILDYHSLFPVIKQV